MARRRLDSELVRRHLADSRTQAQALIAAGRVVVAGTPAAKPATMVSDSESIAITGDQRQWASRAGTKLDGALDELAVDVTGLPGLDAGAAHGGFTDVLLQRGAASVVAVDVAYGQLDWRLRSDPRVTVLERTNVRHLTPADVPGPQPRIVVADLSFISLRLVLAALQTVAAADADFVVLVKPQFEAGRDAVGKGGVVRDPGVWEQAIRSVAAVAGQQGLDAVAVVASSLPGPAGNVEFFLHLRAGAPSRLEQALTDALREGSRLTSG